jgi:tripeptide aminopeptidase
VSPVVERFVRYARMDTQSDPDNAASTPSNDDELALARMLAQELRQMGVADAHADEHAYVTGHLAASAGAQDAPCLGLICHIDVSPDACARGVSPRFARLEAGRIELGVQDDGTSVVVDAGNTPDLAEVPEGAEVVCTDGSTLLGADDKAGVAEVMELVARLCSDPSIPHPALAICFAPDEEIGHGCSLLDLGTFGADEAYTVDGGPIGEVNYETFNAASVTVRFRGRSIHPGSAKGVMVNALHLAKEFDAALPAWERPEHTQGREGFYHLHGLSGTCESATARYIIRDHDDASFERRKQLMQSVAELMNERLGQPRVSCEVVDEYRNMARGVDGHMSLVDDACAAFQACGVQPRVIPVRGGTDGAQLTTRGLPCPNLSAGGFNFHSVREFVPVRSLETMVDVLERLVGLRAGA